MAKRIFAIKKDGLIWKTGDYKKEPVAFGIFKLIVGFSCEDAKVTVVMATCKSHRSNVICFSMLVLWPG